MATHLHTEAVQQSETLLNTLPHNDESVIHVAFGINHNYARGMGITLFSLLKHHPTTAFHIHIFTDTLADDDIDRLKQLAGNQPLAITLHLFNDSWLEKLPAVGRYPKSIYYRFLIPETVARYSDRVFYLDADTLVVGDYSPLFTLDISHVILCASNDTVRARQNQCPKLGLKQGNYFNSGFMLINIPRWLANDTTQKIIDLLVAQGANFGFPDQDALNILLENDTLILPDKYNFIYDIIANKVWHNFSTPNDTVMIHYTGKCKPWHAWSGGNLSHLYLDYYRLSPWSSLHLDKPRHHKEMKRFARIKFHKKEYAASLFWMLNYIKHKFFK
ncbi:MAG: glycosyltransferase [Pantoea sp.]|uniref:glycosyltransferase family 8 protein n=1 Tax=unclassified Pantoea TaxID=2630326 RepID=UPI00055EC8BF|nr:glycosyltransferase [Pantoea sp. AS-PWVM4]